MTVFRTTILAAAVAGSLFLTGCAQIASGAVAAMTTDADLESKTATYFATTADKVALSHIDRGVSGIEYRTNFAKNIYVCSYYYAAVNCRKIER